MTKKRSAERPRPSVRAQIADGSRPLRKDIVQAATQVFSDHGYHGASMRDVADAVGIRKASLYHHVRTKEELLLAIHEHLIDGLIEETMSVVSSSLDHEEKLRECIRVAMNMIAENKEAVTVFLRESQFLTGERWKTIVAKRDLYEQMVTGVIRAGGHAGVFIQRDPEILTKGVLAMANWTYTWFTPDGPKSARQVADTFADIALYGLRGEAAPAS